MEPTYTKGPLAFEMTGLQEGQPTWEIAPVGADGKPQWEKQTALVVSNEADARLYAAAPSLYEALQDALSALGLSESCQDEINAATEKARAALTLVEGATRNGVPPASVPQDATEGVKTTARVWQSPVGMQRLFDSGVLFFRGSPDAEWAVSLHTLPEVRQEMASWRELHGPALAAALSPSVKESPDV